MGRLLPGCLEGCIEGRCWGVVGAGVRHSVAWHERRVRWRVWPRGVRRVRFTEGGAGFAALARWTAGVGAGMARVELATKASMCPQALGSVGRGPSNEEDPGKPWGGMDVKGLWGRAGGNPLWGSVLCWRKGVLG